MRWGHLWPLLVGLTLPTCVVAQALPQWREPVSGIVFVRLPAGCFEQGEAQAGPTGDGMPIQLPREDEVPRRRLCVDEFWLGKTEVTLAQWANVMAKPGTQEPSHPNRPKADVSWEDTQHFVAALNRRMADKRTQFRLPSEAQWEYACQAGQKRAAQQLYGQDRMAWTQAVEREAWFSYPSVQDPHSIEVAGKLPNAWGLHDMLGNVWEWVEDHYTSDAYRRSPFAASAFSGTMPRVIRGGSYKSDVAQVRCGVRNFYPASDQSLVIGLRLIMERRE